MSKQRNHAKTYFKPALQLPLIDWRDPSLKTSDNEYERLIRCNVSWGQTINYKSNLENVCSKTFKSCQKSISLKPKLRETQSEKNGAVLPKIKSLKSVSKQSCRYYTD